MRKSFKMKLSLVALSAAALPTSSFAAVFLSQGERPGPTTSLWEQSAHALGTPFRMAADFKNKLEHNKNRILFRSEELAAASKNGLTPEQYILHTLDEVCEKDHYNFAVYKSLSLKHKKAFSLDGEELPLALRTKYINSMTQKEVTKADYIKNENLRIQNESSPNGVVGYNPAITQIQEAQDHIIVDDFKCTLDEDTGRPRNYMAIPAIPVAVVEEVSYAPSAPAFAPSAPYMEFPEFPDTSYIRSSHSDYDFENFGHTRAVSALDSHPNYSYASSYASGYAASYEPYRASPIAGGILRSSRFRDMPARETEIEEDINPYSRSREFLRAGGLERYKNRAGVDFAGFRSKNKASAQFANGSRITYPSGEAKGVTFETKLAKPKNPGRYKPTRVVSYEEDEVKPVLRKAKYERSRESKSDLSESDISGRDTKLSEIHALLQELASTVKKLLLVTSPDTLEERDSARVQASAVSDSREKIPTTVRLVRSYSDPLPFSRSSSAY